MEFRVRRCEKAHLAPRNSASTRIPKSRPTWSSRCEIHTGECDLMQRMSSLDGTGRAARAALGLTDLRPSSRTLPPRLAVLADERLAWLVARGSKRALSTLYERYESQLYAYCYLLLHELTGLSHSEIATSLGISTQGAKQAIFHARRSLAELQGGRSLACEEVRRMISHRDGRIFRRRSVRAHLRDCRDCTAFAAAI